VLQGGLSILGPGNRVPKPLRGAAIELAIVLQNDLILVLREAGTLCAPRGRDALQMMRNQTANFARPIFEFRIDAPTGVWRRDTTQRPSAASSLKPDEQGE
jgi:hypothetical protein